MEEKGRLFLVAKFQLINAEGMIKMESLHERNTTAIAPADKGH